MKITVKALLACLYFTVESEGKTRNFRIAPDRDHGAVPGRPADVTARMLADGMAKAPWTARAGREWPGAGGAIGYKYVRAQKPDGTR